MHLREKNLSSVAGGSAMYTAVLALATMTSSINKYERRRGFARFGDEGGGRWAGVGGGRSGEGWGGVGRREECWGGGRVEGGVEWKGGGKGEEGGVGKREERGGVGRKEECGQQGLLFGARSPIPGGAHTPSPRHSEVCPGECSFSGEKSSAKYGLLVLFVR